MGERRYSEEALQTILGEAATLSAQRGDTYSLADMQRIAGEIDIDPELVTRAAAAMPIGAATPALPAAAPLVRQVGHRATMAEMTAAIGIAREEFGELGTTVAVGDGVEWRYDSGFSAAVVSIMPESAHTVVRIERIPSCVSMRTRAAGRSCCISEPSLRPWRRASSPRPPRRRPSASPQPPWRSGRASPRRISGGVGHSRLPRRSL